MFLYVYTYILICLCVYVYIYTYVYPVAFDSPMCVAVLPPEVVTSGGLDLMSFLKSSPAELLESHAKTYTLHKNQVLWVPFGFAYVPVALTNEVQPGKAHKKQSIQFSKKGGQHRQRE